MIGLAVASYGPTSTGTLPSQNYHLTQFFCQRFVATADHRRVLIIIWVQPSRDLALCRLYHWQGRMLVNPNAVFKARQLLLVVI